MRTCVVCTYDDIYQFGNYTYCPVCLAVVEPVEIHDEEDFQKLPH